MHDPCFKGWSDEQMNSQGRCCCNCKWQRKIVGHPWNKRNWSKATINTLIGYGCAMPEAERIVLFDSGHGMCEVHDFVGEVIPLRRIK